MKIIDLKKEEFLEIQNKVLKNEDYFKNFPSISFLQSFRWLEIQNNNNKKVFLKKIKIDNNLIGFFLALENNLFNGKKYWYIPRGPVFLGENKNYWPDFFIALEKIALEKKLIFIRFEPIEENFNNFLLLNKKNFRKTKDIQVSKTSFLDLSLNENELLKNMGQKTRYNIKLANKKNVKVFESDISDFEEFWKLISLTAKRDQFFIHSKNYYYNLINSDNNFIKLFTAKFNNKILAVGIFSFFGNSVSYLHGASSNEFRNLMAPYSLQWEIIKLAKSKGFKYYDFCGVDDKKWPGVSRFKRGFGGQEFNYLGTFDYIIKNNFYFIYYFIRKIRRLLKFL